MRSDAPSWYADSVRVELAPAPPLEGRQRADVCIVGAGVTGCSAALHLVERGYHVKLLEAEYPGWGASGRSGGHILPGLGAGMEGAAGALGTAAAQDIWGMSREAVALTEELVARHDIPCDLRWGYVHAAIHARHMRMFRALQQDMAERYGYTELRVLDGAALRERVVTDRYRGGLYEPGGGRLHPLNYTLGLARAAQRRGAELHAASPVTSIAHGDPVCVYTARGCVQADFLVLAGNAYLGELDAGLNAKLMPVGNYMVATEPLSETQIAQSLPQDDAVSDANFVLDYYHLSGDRRLIFGGQASYNGREPRRLRERMEAKLPRLFPVLRGIRISHLWGGWVGITRSRLPHFGRLGGNAYFTQGYSGQGMALGGLAGKVLGEAIAGQAERFDVFARLPHRDFPGGRRLRTPLLALATNYYRLRDLI